MCISTGHLGQHPPCMQPHHLQPPRHKHCAIHPWAKRGKSARALLARAKGASALTECERVPPSTPVRPLPPSRGHMQSLQLLWLES